MSLRGPKGRGNLLRDGQTSASSRWGAAHRSPSVEPKKPSLSLRLLRFARNDTHQLSCYKVLVSNRIILF